MNQCHLLITTRGEPVKEVMVFDSNVERPIFDANGSEAPLSYLYEGIAFDFAVHTNPATGETFRVGQHHNCHGQPAVDVAAARDAYDIVASEQDPRLIRHDTRALWLQAPAPAAAKA